MLRLSLVFGLFLVAPVVQAEPAPPVVQISIRDHLFFPDNTRIKADTHFILEVKNEDASPEEFESESLDLSRILGPGQSARLHVKPLKAGKYCFSGAFHPQSAQGCLQVK